MKARARTVAATGKHSGKSEMLFKGRHLHFTTATVAVLATITSCLGWATFSYPLSASGLTPHSLISTPSLLCTALQLPPHPEDELHCLDPATSGFIPRTLPLLVALILAIPQAHQTCLLELAYAYSSCKYLLGLSFTSFGSLLKCHLISDIFLDHPFKDSKPSPPW